VTSGRYRAAAPAPTLNLTVPNEHVGALRQDLITSLLNAMDDFRIADKNGDTTEMGCSLGRVTQLTEALKGIGLVDQIQPARLIGDRALLVTYLEDMVADYGQWVGELLDESAADEPVCRRELDRVLAGRAAAQTLSNQAKQTV
jgi:hypothetical protein